MGQWFVNVILLAHFSTFGLLAQTSHRRLDPQPRRDLADVFNQSEKQKSESPGDELARKAAVRRQRSADLAELQQDLPRLVELAQGLQNRLNASDLEAALPADLEKKASALEQVARRVHKRIRNL